MGIFSENINDIESYYTKLELLFSKQELTDLRVSLCVPMLKKISEEPSVYDRTARLNAQWIGGELISIISGRKTDDGSLHELTRYLARIARETTLRTPYIPKTPEKELLDFFDYSKHYETKEDKETSDLIWASIPKYIARDYLDEVSKKEEDIARQVKTWEDQLKAYKTTIDSYITELKDQQGKFNFVRLSKAFHEMHKNKLKELKSNFIALISLGTLVVSPLIFQFVAKTFTNTDITLNSLSATEAWKLISLVGLEVALLYFFRIALKSYYSTKAQLLQIELRLSLCAFIENYADFAKSRKTKDADPLLKFESIIFSGITPDDSNVPSTFDGVDQLFRLAKELKGK
ncbi:hypothetical protein [Stutzerimonas stutzeri]|uniref:hypothetical protein n=1 Tax=Stutzerimonas stutzeri TaxID=316 RepID=UPI001C785794|nr:hypothetical protein [Stutzerimonas stutzeri]BCY01381.1 hypothetical protein PszF2a_11700 [Stutzerimonas stutzeri]